MNLQDFLKQVGGKKTDIKAFTGVEALAAVQQNGGTLQFVQNQTN